MARRRRPYASVPESENFWPSFTDLISTIALLLFVLVLLAYVQNLISGKKLAHMRAQLVAAATRLETSQREVSAAEQRLSALALDIKAAEGRVAAQDLVIADSTRELSDLRARLQSIAVLRAEVLTRVKDSIEAQLGPAKADDKPRVLIAENGNLVINESLVFEYDSHTIKAQGKPLLNTLSKAFANVLGDAAVRDSIDVVLVQGHTDERGAVAYNRELSAKRANAVLDYMFESNHALEELYGAYFASAAYSEFRPISGEGSDAARRQNRRIEVSVVLKDASIRTVIDQYMKAVTPAQPGSPPAPGTSPQPGASPQPVPAH